jgi:tol-pal system protein YbgF
MKSAGNGTGVAPSSFWASSTRRRMLRRGTLLLLGLPLAAGCATRADLLQVQQEMRETRALVADQQVALDGVRRRLDILRNELGDGGRGGRGTPSAQLQQRLNTLDARVTALEDHRGTVLGTPTPEAAPTPPFFGMAETPPLPEAPPTPRPQSPMEVAIAREESAAAGAEAEYRDALKLIKENRCSQAVPKLRDFIRRNPKSAFADNAQYWIGACYYEQRDYSRSIIELNDLVLKYQKGDKVPAALLMMADAFADSGDKIDARLVLQKLISQYGSSPEAEQARQKLQSLSE